MTIDAGDDQVQRLWWPEHREWVLFTPDQLAAYRARENSELGDKAPEWIAYCKRRLHRQVRFDQFAAADAAARAEDDKRREARAAAAEAQRKREAIEAEIREIERAAARERMKETSAALWAQTKLNHWIMPSASTEDDCLDWNVRYANRLRCNLGNGSHWRRRHRRAL